MKKILISVLITLISIALNAQVHENKPKSSVSPGHAKEKGVKSETPESTKNQKKERNTRARAKSKNASKASSDSQTASPKGSGGTIPQSDMSAVQNYRKDPLGTSMRDNYAVTKKWDLGINLGSAYDITDVSMNKDYSFGNHVNGIFEQTNLNFGFFSRYKVSSAFALQMGFDFAQMEGKNNLSNETNPLGSYRFENSIFEFFLKTEFHIPYNPGFPLRVYGFAGVSAFFSEVSLYNNNGFKVNINDDFSQVQPAIPLGIGLFYQFSNNAKIGAEFGWRKTVFDYVDGIKGSHKAYDSYMLNSIKLSISF